MKPLPLKNLVLALAIVAGTQLHVAAHQPPSGTPINLPAIPPEAEWFYSAKLGIFLHWGIYAVDGTVESHPFNQPPAAFEREGSKAVPHDQYFSQMPRFTAANYDPAKWAEVFRKAGAKYSIITTKHHDGFALWDSKVPQALNAVKDSPAGRDLIAPWVEAMRANGIRPGFYFSLCDWHHPDYASLQPRPDGRYTPEEGVRLKPYSYALKNDPVRWERYLNFMFPQLDELAVHKPDIWWFDGGWERTKEQFRGDEIAARIFAANPNAIIGRPGFRWPEGTMTYQTPERAVPTQTPDGLWELCQTSNEHWSYRPMDTLWKSADVLVQMFSEVIARGGNLLLNIGPKEDGTLPVEAVEPLLALGEWIQRNEEAIYPTFGGEQAGISFARFNGPSTVSRDGKTLYLFVHSFPPGGILLRGIVSVPTKITVLATGEEVKWRQMYGNRLYPGWFELQTPGQTDPLSTVLKLEFDKVIEIEGTAPKAQNISTLGPPPAPQHEIQPDN